MIRAARRALLCRTNSVPASVTASARPGWRSATQPVEQLIEHLLLAGRGDPVGVEHPLGAQAVDQDEQLVGGQRDVDAARSSPRAAASAR